MDATALQRIVGRDWVITSRDQMLSQLRDAIFDPVMPEVAKNIILVKPANAVEISRILKLANSEKFPVIVRGGGTGLAGGAVPTVDCVLLSTERLDVIEEIDKANLMITAEAGVPYSKLVEVAEATGLFFPPKPGDAGLGGSHKAWDVNPGGLLTNNYYFRNSISLCPSRDR